MEYVKRNEVLKALKITYPTLYAMKDRKEIDTVQIGKHTLYNLNKYLADKGINIKGNRKICYCRVSSSKQKEDLNRQIETMRDKYPNHEIITDIGSGLNYKRKGLQMIINMSINGEVEELIIVYID